VLYFVYERDCINFRNQADRNRRRCTSHRRFPCFFGHGNYAFSQGATPEQIVEDYDSLELSEVYAVISYYLQNREEVENYLERRTVQREQLRQQIEASCNPQGIRERLLVRRRN
jgi:hypothetical protein